MIETVKWLVPSLVEESDEVMLITDGGILVRTRVSEVSTLGRNTQGVTLIGVDDDESLISIQKVAESDDDTDVGDGIAEEPEVDPDPPVGEHVGSTESDESNNTPESEDEG